MSCWRARLFLSLVVGRPRTLWWRDGDGSGAPRQGLFVEAVGKDRLHASIRVGTKVKCPATRRLDAFGAVAIGEADDAERGAEALLGMGRDLMIASTSFAAEDRGTRQLMMRLGVHCHSAGATRACGRIGRELPTLEAAKVRGDALDE